MHGRPCAGSVVDKLVQTYDIAGLAMRGDGEMVCGPRVARCGGARASETRLARKEAAHAGDVRGGEVAG